MKIVITGSTGYLGRELIRQLNGSGYIIFAASSEVKKAKLYFGDSEVINLSNENLLNGVGGGNR